MKEMIFIEWLIEIGYKFLISPIGIGIIIISFVLAIISEYHYLTRSKEEKD